MGRLLVGNWFGVPNPRPADLQVSALVSHVRVMSDAPPQITRVDPGVSLPDERTRAVIVERL